MKNKSHYSKKGEKKGPRERRPNFNFTHGKPNGLILGSNWGRITTTVKTNVVVIRAQFDPKIKPLGFSWEKLKLVRTGLFFLEGPFFRPFSNNGSYFSLKIAWAPNGEVFLLENGS